MSRTYVCLALLALLATSANAQEEKDQCQTCKDLVNATRQVGNSLCHYGTPYLTS